jgi:RimJ/RimL family protein N-acetyltransferase
MGYLKQAADNNETAGLLETIRAETPAYWPEGLSVQHFKQGNLWTIHEKQGNAVGFVGWQERREDFEKVGYYSIGVLPEYRRRGIAKEAVSQLLRHKAASVDRVKAFIRAGNEPSEALARDLGVQVKQASKAALLKILPYILTGGATAGVTDQMMWSGQGYSNARLFDGLFNAGVGAYGGGKALRGSRILRTEIPNLLKTQVTRKTGLPTAAALRQAQHMGETARHQIASGLGHIAIAPAVSLGINFKRLMTRGVEADEEANNIAAKAQEALATGGKKVTEALSGTSPWAVLAGAGLLTGGLAYGASRVAQSVRDKAEAPINIQTTQGGRLKVTLPTKNPDDAETVLDLPYDQNLNLSNALRTHLRVDTTRRLRAEVNQRRRGKGITAPTSIETASVRA